MSEDCDFPQGYAIVDGVTIAVEGASLEDGSMVAMTAHGTVRVPLVATITFAQEDEETNP